MIYDGRGVTSAIGVCLIMVRIFVYIVMVELDGRDERNNIRFC